MKNNFLIPSQVMESTILSSVNKSKMPLLKILILGFFAGMFVAFGAASSSAAMFGIHDPGLSRSLAGVIFPVGLMMILFVGGELFTGNCLMITGVMDRKIKTSDFMKNLCLVYVSNFAGSLFAAVLQYSGASDGLYREEIGAYAIKVAYGKVTLDGFSAFQSGICCNILVCAAVLMAACATDIIGKIVALFFPIMAFVIAGFEHCVANMYYIPAGMLAVSNEKYAAKAMELYGFTRQQLDMITPAGFVLHNLIPVTLGNIVGGSFVIAVPLYLVYKSESRSSIKAVLSKAIPNKDNLSYEKSV